MEDKDLAALMDAIDLGLSNRYKVIDGDEYIICVHDRETGKDYDIRIEECVG